MGILLMANHSIPAASFPMSGTVMLQHLVETEDNAGSEDELTSSEVALALLTNPTGDSHFGVNAEVAYLIEAQDRDSVAGDIDDTTTLTVSLEAIAVIP